MAPGVTETSGADSNGPSSGLAPLIVDDGPTRVTVASRNRATLFAVQPFNPSAVRMRRHVSPPLSHETMTQMAPHGDYVWLKAKEDPFG